MVVAVSAPAGAKPHHPRRHGHHHGRHHQAKRHHRRKHHRGRRRLIVPGRSIGRFNFSYSARRIHHALGRPDDKTRYHGKISSLSYYASRNLGFSFDPVGPGDKLDLISTTGRHYHTAKGVRIGSRPRRVKRAYPGVRREGRYDLVLFHGAPGATGTRRTTFHLFDHRVDQITVQIQRGP
jgi:hypothetical protein